MAHNKDYNSEGRGDCPSTNQDPPSYQDHGACGGGYGGPRMLSWHRGYEQGYCDPQREYGSVYDSAYHSSASHGQLGFTEDAVNRPPLYDYGPSQPAAQVDTSHVPHVDRFNPHVYIPRAGQHQGPYVPPLSNVTPSPNVPQMADTHGSTAQLPLCVEGQDGSGMDLSYTGPTDSSSSTSYAGSFLAQVQKFVVEHKEAFDLLVEGNKGCEDEIHHNVHSSEMYEFGQPDALEYHMDVDTRLRQSRLLELISVGDVVRGHVIDKSPREFTVQVTSFVGSHKFRELSDIGITGVVPLNDLADVAEKCGDVLSEMELDDVVQGVVTHQKENGCLSLSFRGDHVEQLCLDGQLPSGVKLGYMEGKRAVLPRSSIPKSDDYLTQLEEDPGFLNPSSSDNLKMVLGIRSTSGTVPLGAGRRPTLIKEFQKQEFSDSDFCHALRKAQRNKWSMDTVAVGVKFFKAGESSKAKKYFDHALEIDATNVEGLVARGALFANDGKYKEGIADFEKALTLKHTHRNARNYLVQTQVAYGERLERECRLKAAAQCYREALADDPDHATARTRLKVITTALEKQAAEKKEIERKKSEEKATLRKLQKLIEKEQGRKNKKSKSRKSTRKKVESKTKTYRKKKKVSSRAKTKKERHRRRRDSSDDYSSDESTETATSNGSKSPHQGLSSRARTKSQRVARSISKSKSPRSRSPRSRSPRSRSPRSSSDSKTKVTLSKTRESKWSHRRSETKSSSKRSESRYSSRSRETTPSSPTDRYAKKEDKH